MLNKNQLYEDIIDQTMIDEVCEDNESIRNTLEGLDITQRRLAILSILDNGRELFKQIKTIILQEPPSKTKHIKNRIIKPEELDRMFKPFSYIIIPNITNNNEDDKENFISLINDLRSYGFDPSEDIIRNDSWDS
jgi:hypothetical protein